MIKRRTFISIIMTLICLILSNKYWLIFKTKTSVHFDFEIFIIITVLSFLLIYKLTDYLADFKTTKRKSRIDIVFLLLFFIMLFVPMMHIDTKSTKSITENRSLAKYKPLFNEEHKINYNYGNDFNSWYNDRFYTRNCLVKLNKKIRYNMAKNYYSLNDIWLNKKNNCMEHSIITEETLFSKKELNESVRNVKRLKQYCDNNNIKLYIIIVPQKSELYQNISAPVTKIIDNRKKTIQMKNYIKKHTGVEIIYMYDQLKALSKKEWAYFKTDHHWTDEGAYLGYLSIMEQVKKDFPNIHITGRDEYNYKYSNKVRVNPIDMYHEGYTYKRIGLKNKNIFDTEYKYFVYKNADNIEFDYKEFDEGYQFLNYKNPIEAPNLVLFGDSFTLNLLPILPNSFHYTENIYTHLIKGIGTKGKLKRLNIKRFEDEITAKNTDVLIICFCEIEKLNFLYRKGE